MQSHMIQRMVFELSMVGSETDLESEKKANEYHKYIIVPAVQECFRDIDTPEQQLIINSLDIDLGVFTPESFEKEAKSRLIERLDKQLRKAEGYKPEKNYSSREYRSRSEYNLELLRTSNNEDPKRKQANRLELYYHAFTFFLDRGRFPWWFVIDHQEKTNDDIKEQFGLDWIQSLNHSEKSDLRRRLLKAVGHTRTRLATTFSAEWTGELLHRIGLSGREALNLWAFIIPAFQDVPEILPVFRQHFWTSWILAAGKERRYTDLKHTLEKTTKGNQQLLRELSVEIYKIYKNSDYSGFSDRVILALKTLENTGTSREEQDPIDLTVPDEHRDKEPDSPGKDQWQKTDIPSESFPESEADEFLGDNDTSEDVDLLKEQMQDDTDLEKESVFIQAAGLVLLHPFLSELFEQTALWDGESWLSDEAQLRAVLLLLYLTYGDVDVPEYRLLLHKILAGLELETVLQAVPALTPEELSACDELLDAVIQHWKALRNTSPDGLREGFLLREGKLTPSDKGYRLHIEKRTEDILLSHLPWGYSIVQLPWMSGLLNISWV